jgi:hypothetical protein
MNESDRVQVWIDPKGGTHYHKFDATRKEDMLFDSNVCIDKRYKLVRFDTLVFRCIRRKTRQYHYVPCPYCYPRYK